MSTVTAKPRLVAAGVMALGLWVCACAEAPLPPPQATLENIQAVRAAQLKPMALGSFSAAPGQPADMDKGITIRAGYQPAPDGSFARYLGQTIAAQLLGAGQLQAASGAVLSGVVTETHADSSLPTARAALGAQFTLLKDGKAVFQKTLRAETTWSSNFIGAVAIPDAFDHYESLFPKLANTLFTDPDFVAAAR